MLLSLRSVSVKVTVSPRDIPGLWAAFALPCAEKLKPERSSCVVSKPTVIWATMTPPASYASQISLDVNPLGNVSHCDTFANSGAAPGSIQNTEPLSTSSPRVSVQPVQAIPMLARSLCTFPLVMPMLSTRTRRYSR